jgi:hypothetical protein
MNKKSKPKILKSRKRGKGARPNTCRSCGGSPFC